MNMKINELIKVLNNKKNKMLKAEQKQEILKKELEVKEYLSVKDKKELVDTIINNCILYSDGIYKFDDFEKYICFTMYTIAAYTNLELSADIEEDYDVLCRHKLLRDVISTFQEEYDEVNIMLQMQSSYLLSENDIEAQIGRFLNSILDRLDDFADVIADSVNKFDISKLPIGKDDLIKLLDFVDKNKK